MRDSFKRSLVRCLVGPFFGLLLRVHILFGKIKEISNKIKKILYKIRKFITFITKIVQQCKVGEQSSEIKDCPLRSYS